MASAVATPAVDLECDDEQPCSSEQSAKKVTSTTSSPSGTRTFDMGDTNLILHATTDFHGEVVNKVLDGQPASTNQMQRN